MKVKCEQCGHRIDEPLVFWINNYPHHAACFDDVIEEMNYEKHHPQRHPDAPRATPRATPYN